jgi:hypothetical protein
VSFASLLKRVCHGLTQIRQSDEVEVLRSTPVETLYLALKEADADTALWVFENATPKQIQRIWDLDCWSGPNFLIDRFYAHFRSVVECEPARVAELIHKTDLELWVRAIIEEVQVVDFDPQNPPEWPDEQSLLSYDNKYALLFKKKDDQKMELFRIWLNKHSAGDLEHHRKLLEACKWELGSDLEEFAYRVQKGRIEEIGFVDRSEAIALYAVGSAPKLRSQLESMEPLKKSPEKAIESLELLPSVVDSALNSPGLFSDACSRLDNGLRQTILQEKLRVIHAGFAADDVLQASIDELAESAQRSHHLIDLGLFYLSSAQVERAAEMISTRPLFQIYRLGWLMQQDLIRVAQSLNKDLSPQTLMPGDLALISNLSGRHPKLSDEVLLAWGLSPDSLRDYRGLLDIGQALVDLKKWSDFFTAKLGPTLALNQRSLKAGQAPTLLLTGLFVAASNGAPKFEAISENEFKDLVKRFDPQRFDEQLELLIASESPFIKKRLVGLGLELKQIVQGAGLGRFRPEWTQMILWRESI